MMFGSGLIELIIGLILIYFLFSLLTSGINELAEQFLHRRAKFLESGIVDILGPWARKFYQHPLIQALHPEQGRPQTLPPPGASPPVPPKFGPSYIPSRTFSRALLSLVADASTHLTAEIPEHGQGASLQFTVASSLGFPSTGQFKVRIDSELFRVNSMTNNVWSAQAAVDDTAASQHTAGAELVRIRSASPTSAELLADLSSNIDRIPGDAVGQKLKDSLRAFLTDANQDIEEWRASIEAWFDDKMDRVGGWYKRRTKWWLLLWGAAIVLVFNADTIVFARALYTDSALRASVVTAASNIVQAAPSPTGSPAPAPSPTPCPIPTGATAPASGTLQCVAEEVRGIKDLGLPLGWNKNGPGWPRGAAGIPLKLAGLLITAAALTLGAPFWFDLLNKFVNFRGAGRPPPRQEEKRA